MTQMQVLSSKSIKENIKLVNMPVQPKGAKETYATIEVELIKVEKKI